MGQGNSRRKAAGHRRNTLLAVATGQVAGILLAVSLTCSPALGQTPEGGVELKPNALWFELFGRGLLGMVAYERLISPEAGVNVGGLILPGFVTGEEDAVGISLSLAARMVTFGRHSLLLVPGTGFVGSRDEGWVLMTLGVYYEYRHGLLLRAGYTPHLAATAWGREPTLPGRRGVAYLPLWGGIAVGGEF